MAETAAEVEARAAVGLEMVGGAAVASEAVVCPEATVSCTQTCRSGSPCLVLIGTLYRYLLFPKRRTCRDERLQATLRLETRYSCYNQVSVRSSI
jgi:hypothetical protein